MNKLYLKKSILNVSKIRYCPICRGSFSLSTKGNGYIKYYFCDNEGCLTHFKYSLVKGTKFKFSLTEISYVGYKEAEFWQPAPIFTLNHKIPNNEIELKIRGNSLIILLQGEIPFPLNKESFNKLPIMEKIQKYILLS
jgi:hypothetical protein